MFHDLSGWAMLALAFVLLMGTVRLLRWAEVPVMQHEVRRGVQTREAAGLVAA